MWVEVTLSVGIALILGLPAFFVLWGKTQETLKTHGACIEDMRKALETTKTEAEGRFSCLDKNNEELKTYVARELKTISDLGWERELGSTKKLNEVSEKVIKIDYAMAYIKETLDKIDKRLEQKDSL
jgi:hypothetical protein